MPNDTQQDLSHLKREDSPQNGKVRMRLISPLFLVDTQEADSILLPAIDGDILILPDRAPLFLTLRPGRMTLFNKGQEPIHYLVSSGICEIRRNLCPVLAWGGREDRINPEMIAHHLATALETLPNLETDQARSQVASRIDFFEFVLKELKYDKKIEPIKSKKGVYLKLRPEDLGVKK